MGCLGSPSLGYNGLHDLQQVGRLGSMQPYSCRRLQRLDFLLLLMTETLHAL